MTGKQIGSVAAAGGAMGLFLGGGAGYLVRGSKMVVPAAAIGAVLFAAANVAASAIADAITSSGTTTTTGGGAAARMVRGAGGERVMGAGVGISAVASALAPAV